MGQNKLGERIKAFREMQDMSREELGRRTDLGETFIATLEEEDVSPSIGPLLKIARELGVRMGTFLDDEFDSDMSLVRKADRSEEVTMRKARGKRETMKFHPLGAAKSDRHMEPFFIELFPDDCEDKTLSSHEGEEFIVVISGEVEFVHGKDSYVLAPGDSIYFNSIVPHYVGCGDADKAEIHAVLYVPE